jgi:hypothetical protein
MKPCNITSKLLIIARLYESNKTTAQYLVSTCIISYFLDVTYILVYKSLNTLKEKNAFMLQSYTLHGCCRKYNLMHKTARYFITILYSYLMDVDAIDQTICPSVHSQHLRTNRLVCCIHTH